MGDKHLNRYASGLGRRGILAAHGLSTDSNILPKNPPRRQPEQSQAAPGTAAGSAGTGAGAWTAELSLSQRPGEKRQGEPLSDDLPGDSNFNLDTYVSDDDGDRAADANTQTNAVR